MNIYITGLGSGYEVEHLVRLFYPMAPLTLTPPEDGADCVWAEKRPDKLWAMVRQGGKSQTAEAPLPAPAEEGGETPEFALASLTYDLLRRWTGIRPPWGKPLHRHPVLPLPVQLLQLRQLQPRPGPQAGAALCGLPLP